VALAYFGKLSGTKQNLLYRQLTHTLRHSGPGTRRSDHERGTMNEESEAETPTGEDSDEGLSAEHLAARDKAARMLEDPEAACPH